MTFWWHAVAPPRGSFMTLRRHATKAVAMGNHGTTPMASPMAHRGKPHGTPRQSLLRHIMARPSARRGSPRHDIMASPTIYHGTLHDMPQERLVVCPRQPTGTHGEPTALMTPNPMETPMVYHGKPMTISTASPTQYPGRAVASLTVISTTFNGKPYAIPWQALRHIVASPTPYHDMHHGIRSRPRFEIGMFPKVPCGRMRFDAV